MKFVFLIYQGSAPLPGSDRWNALSEAVQKKIYADYAEPNTEGISQGLPLGLPAAAIALAARIPAARLGGAVEIRPAEKYW